MMTHIVSDTAGAVIPLITVDCAYKKLEAPPASLPPGTTTLRLEGNKVTRYEDFFDVCKKLLVVKIVYSKTLNNIAYQLPKGAYNLL